MFTLKVTNKKGNMLELSHNKNYQVYKMEGLNPPEVTINESANTTTDGSSINSARVNSRNLVIYMTIEGAIDTNRLALYRYFPVKQDVTLYFKNGKRDVYITGKVELIECDLFSNKQVAQISLICPKPYFKDINEMVTAFSDVSSMFSFPFSIASTGMEISAITSNVRKSIINTGDVDTGVIIKLFSIGTVVNPTLYDVINKTYIKLNFTMQESDTIVINTNVGEKSIILIRSGESSNAMGYMTPDSTWFTLSSGDNVYTYDCDSGSANLQITFTTQLLYSGV